MQLLIENLLDMAPSDTQFEKLKDRIKLLEAKSSQTGQSNSSWVQRHQVLTWLISLTALLFAFYAGVIPHIEKDDALEIKNQLSEGLKTPLQNLSTMASDIAEIKGTLKAWAPFMAPEILKNSSSLSQDEFNKSLLSLHNAMRVAIQSRAVIPNETLQQIALKLRRTNESNPEYWPTILQFIEFATASLIPPTDVPPANARFSQVSNISCIGLGIGQHCMEASHCAIILDGGHIPNSIFDHCRIRFTNNPVGLEGTRFTDCIFEMPTDVTQPTPYLKQSAKNLLASDLRQIIFPGS